MASNTVQATVYGVVQGVGFRAWVQRNAAALALSGWVRNLPNGCVEALLQGERQAVEEMLALLKIGPSLSQVEAVKSVPVENAEPHSGFSIRR
jgi:acylphosphatase